MLIALEGIDGAGKTTVGIEAVIQLKKMAYDVEYIKFPTESVVSDIKLWHDYKGIVLDIFANDHHSFLEKQSKDKIYIMDRSFISMFAYNVRGQDTEYISPNKLKIWFTPYVIDHTFVFEVPYWTSHRRIAAKKIDSGINDRQYTFDEFKTLVSNIRTEARLWSRVTTFIDNYMPYSSFAQSVERVVNGIVKVQRV